MTRISIIVPAFNAAATLERALRSLRAQRWADWEAIVIDDGSSDRTAEIADDAAAVDGRIRCVRRSHDGVCAARNAGLAEARGDWVLFLDADDALAADHLEIMMRAASQTPAAGLLHCGWQRVIGGRPWREPHAAARIDDPMRATARHCPFAIHAALTRRDLVQAVGGFDPALRIAEDWDLWQRLARSGVIFEPVPDSTVDVYVEPGSLSSDSARHLSDGLMVMRRGHAADPRLPADVPFAHGAPLAEFASAAWRFAIWVAAAALGRGDDPVALLLQHDLPAPADIDPVVFARIVEDGLAIGAGPAAGALYARWSSFAAGIDALCDHIAMRADAPDLSRQIQRVLEDMVVGTVPPGIASRIGRTAIVVIDLGEPLRDRPLPGIHRVRPIAMVGRDLIADAGWQFAFGALSSSWQLAWVRALLDRAEIRSVLVRERVRRGPFALGLPFMQALKQYARLVRSRYRPHVHRHARLPHEDVRELLIRALPSGEDGRAADARIAAILSEEQARLPAPEPADEQTGDWVEPDYTREAYWEGVFAQVDPWNYRNDYETLKYEQTLDLIADERIDSALEIACAEGEFTRRLAPRVGRLLATDIAPTAVARAQSACADLANCSFQRLDLLTETPPDSYDLIVASEVLYYLDPAAMAAFVDKVAAHLKPGGLFLTAHANLLVDEPDRTGFGWPHHFGAKGIGLIVLGHGELALETELWTPLYRIMRFRKGGSANAASARHVIADAARNLPLRVARQVKWRGGREAPVADAWHDFPILMYHRVATDGPAALARWRTHPDAFEAQLRYLREGGWHGVSFRRMREAVHGIAPLPERTVMLTFDDATRDFLDHAVPLLHRYGFPATLFVPTGHVGGVAAWDAAHGDPARLLDWDELRMLQHCDVAIGSHGVSHRPLLALDPEALVRELAESRFRLAHELGEPVTSIAYPFGDFDPLIRDAAKRVGYDFAFTCIDRRISGTADPLALFRREVMGGIDMQRFGTLLAGE